MAPPHVGPAGYAFAMALPLHESLGPARHSVEIPSSSPDELLVELEQVFAARFARASELVSGNIGAHAFEIPEVGEDASFVALLPKRSSVLVVVLRNSRRLPIRELRAHLEPSPEKLTLTPAISSFASSKGPRAYIRARNLRDYVTWSGVTSAHSAYESLPPARSLDGPLRALVVAATPSTYGADSESDATDAAWTADVSGPSPRMRVVTTLTSKGSERFGQAHESVRPLPTPIEHGAAGVRVEMDLARLLARSETLDLPDGLEHSKLVRECPVCTLDMLLRHPTGLFKDIWLENGGGDLSAAFAFHVLWPQSAKRGESWGMVTTPQSPQARLEQMVDQLLGSGAERESQEPFDFFGDGVSYGEVFGPPGHVTSGADLVRASFQKEGRKIEFRMRASPGALVYDVAFGVALLPETAPLAKLVETSSPYPEDAARCLLNATQQARALLKRASPDERRLEGLRTALRCARSSPLLVAAADRLETAVGEHLTQRAMTWGSLREAIKVSAWMCAAKAPSDPSCSRARDIKWFQAVNPPGPSVDPSCVEEEKRSTIVYRDGKYLVGTRTVPADRDQLTRALLDLIPPHARNGRKKLRFGLRAPGATPFSELRPVFEAVGSMGGHLLPVVNADDQIVMLTATLDWKTSQTVDWQLGPHYVAPEEVIHEDEPMDAKPTVRPRTERMRNRSRWSDIAEAAAKCAPPVVLTGSDR